MSCASAEGEASGGPTPSPATRLRRFVDVGGGASRCDRGTRYQWVSFKGRRPYSAGDLWSDAEFWKSRFSLMVDHHLRHAFDVLSPKMTSRHWPPLRLDDESRLGRPWKD